MNFSENIFDKNLNSPGRDIDFYEALAEAQSDMGEAVFVLDDHIQKYLYVNQAMCKIFGYTSEELLALETNYLLVAPECRQERRSRGALRLIRAALTDHYETVGLKKDGTRFPIEISIKSIEGSETKSVGLLRDITDRKLKEKTVSDAYKVIDDLFNRAPCGYHSANKDGVYLYANDTYLNWLGYSRSEFIGKTTIYDVAAPGSSDRMKDRFQEFVSDMKPRDAEFELQRKDGSTFPILLKATAITDEKGQFVMSRTMTFDMTEKKRAEDEIRRSHELQLKLASANNTLFLLVDTEQKIMFVGPVFETYTGWTPAEVLGRPLADFVLPGEAVQVEQALQMTFVMPESVHHGIHVLTKGGDALSTEISISPFMKKDLRCGAVVVARLTTEGVKKLVSSVPNTVGGAGPVFLRSPNQSITGE